MGDLPQPLQVKLLRAIQEKKIRPVGDHREIPVNVRLLSATHQNLAKMIQEGSFRQDLYYRINVIELNVPPLRVRGQDIEMLAEHILTKLTRSNEQTKPSLSKSALAALKHYDFPGNVRELENILERALALYEGNYIDAADLNLPIHIETPPPNEDYVPDMGPLEDYLEEIEKKAICDALEKARWNKTAAAKKLGLSFRSLRYRLKKLNLD